VVSAQRDTKCPESRQVSTKDSKLVSLLSIPFTELDTSFNCGSCGSITANSEALAMLQSLQSEVNSVQALEMGAKRLEGSCADDDDASDHRGECQVFSAARVTFAGNVSDDGVCPQLDCITPLRLVRRGSSGGSIHNSAGSGGPGAPGGTCQNISFGSRGPFLGDRMRAGKYRKLIATTSKKAVDQKHRVGHGGANNMNRVSSVYNVYIMIFPRIKIYSKKVMIITN